MRKLNIVVPMAGAGSRFKQNGILTPKPLICAGNIPLFERAINSVVSNFSEEDVNLYCIVQSKHCDEFNLDSRILEKYPQANVIKLDGLTRGAVETCLSATRLIANLDDAMIVIDCDIEWSSYNYISHIKNLLRSSSDDIGGLLLSFESDNPRYSYALSDLYGSVKLVAEKKVISNQALIGAYYFNSVKLFNESANKLIETNELSKIKEYYTSLLYNYIINSHNKVYVHRSDSFNSFGTPEELDSYEHTNCKN